MPQPKIVESKVICPKCKSNDLYLVELWKNSSIQWDQQNGKFDKNDGNLAPDGHPYRVEATCKNCGHVWKIRKVTQIDEIIKD